MACNCGKKAQEGVRRAATRSAEVSASIKTQVSAAERVRQRQAEKAAATTTKAASV